MNNTKKKKTERSYSKVVKRTLFQSDDGPYQTNESRCLMRFNLSM